MTATIYRTDLRRAPVPRAYDPGHMAATPSDPVLAGLMGVGLAGEGPADRNARLVDGSASRRRLAAPLRAWHTALGGVVGVIAGTIGAGLHVTALVGPVLGVLAVAVAVTDLRERRIPDQLVVAGASAAVLVALVVALEGGLRPVTGAVLGVLVAALPLLAVHLVVPAGLGFGDVKFAAVVGALLGVISPGLAGLAVVAASVIAVVGAFARIWPRSSIPFGACLALTAVGCAALGRWWAT